MAGAETGSVAPYWESPDTRLAGRAGVENHFTMEPMWSVATDEGQEGRVKTQDVVPLAFVCGLELLEVQVLDEIRVG